MIKLALVLSFFLLVGSSSNAQLNTEALSAPVQKAFANKNYQLAKSLIINGLQTNSTEQQEQFAYLYFANTLFTQDSILARKWEQIYPMDSFAMQFSLQNKARSLSATFNNCLRQNAYGAKIMPSSRYYQWVERIEKLCIEQNDWLNLAQCQLFWGDLTFYIPEEAGKATNYYKKGLSICKEHNLLEEKLVNYLYMSLIYNLYGVEKNFELALAYIEEFSKIVEKQKEKLIELQEIRIDIMKQKGDFERSYELIREQYEICKKDNNLSTQQAIAEIKIGEYYTRKGSYKEADKWYNSARSYLQKYEQAVQSHHFFWLNYLYGQQTNNFLRWGNRVDTAYKTLKLMEINTHLVRAEFYYPHAIEIGILKKDSNGIKKLLNTGLSLFLQSQRIGASDVPALLAFSKAADYIKQPDNAFLFAERAEQMLNISYQERKQKSSTIDPLLTLGVLKQKIMLIKRHRPNQSYQKEVNLAIALLDNLRQSYSTKGAKELLLNDAMFFYEAAIELCYQQAAQKGQIDNLSIAEIFYLSEKSKSMLLLEALQENKARQFANIPNQLRSNEISLLNDVNYYEAQVAHETNPQRKEQYQNVLSVKRKQLDSIKNILQTQHSKYFEYKYAQKISQLEEIQTQLGEKMLMLHYFAGKNNLYVIAISQQKAFIHSIAVNDNYYNRLSYFIERLSSEYYIYNHLSQNFNLFCADAHWLYNDLIQPFIKELETNNYEKLVIVPDGKLHYLPFELLLSSEKIEGENGDKNYQDLPYLLTKYGVSYAYSGTIWGENMLSKPSPNADLLALAPTYKTKTIPPKTEQERVFAILTELEGTKAEVNWLQKFFRGTFLTHEQATEAQFKSHISHSNIVHLSMHGVLDENPAYSGLYFCPNRDSSEDNILYAYEIPSLELSADLVVLSACETGLGRYQHGEGVISLGRSFMYAGAPAIITSLWSVNDNAAVFLMEHFYTNLHSGKDKTESLRQAKLAYLKQAKGIAAHPFFWAAFILQGNHQPINVPQKRVWIWWAGGFMLTTAIGYFIFQKRGAKVAK